MIALPNGYTLNVLLVLVAIVLIYFTWNGFKKGFVKLMISLVSMILTFFLVATITPTVCNFITENTRADEICRERIYEALLEKNSARENLTKDEQEETIRSYSFPEMLKRSLIEHNTEEEYKSLIVTAFADYVSGFLSKLLIKIAAFLFTYAMIMVLLQITFFSLDAITKIPVIHGINQLSGLCFGLLEGLFIVWMIFCILLFVMKDDFYSLIYQSKFLTLIYEENPIFKFLRDL